MGIFNSSKTRVAPMFDRLIASDPTGRSWLPTLLALPAGGAPFAEPTSCDLGIVSHWWEGNPAERAMAPPLSLLRWLVDHVVAPEDSSAVWNTSAETCLKRRGLVDRDPGTIREALDALQTQPTNRAWYVLEGKSYPDVYLETQDTIVVIEGKRTEGKPTRATSWMPGRHQMWRHIDCAWEGRGHKRLCGLMIVETDAEATAFATETMRGEVIDSSLPHRSSRDRDAIVNCFLGTTTWKTVCDHCSIPWEEIVADAEEN